MEDTFHIQWHITNFCNLRCRHCYQDNFSKEKELDWSGLEAVAENLFSFLEAEGKIASLHLTGGEPFLKPELFPLLDLLDRCPRVYELGIITNGLLFNEETLKRLTSFSKLRKIKLSLDGAVKETNDSIRGEKTFERILNQVSLIQNRTHYEIVFMFTLMRRNFREIPALIELSQKLGVGGVILERFVPLGRGRERMDEVLTGEAWREVKQILLDLFSIEDEDVLRPYQAFQVKFSPEGSELSGAPCVIGRDGLCVMPDGEALPCRRFPVSIGNLLQTPLNLLWDQSELLKVLRRRENLKGRCGRCDLQDCRGCRALALALTGDPLAEDPSCMLPSRFADRERVSV